MEFVFKKTLTSAKFAAFGQIEGLHLTLSDIHVQHVPHEERFILAGEGVSDLCNEEMH